MKEFCETVGIVGWLSSRVDDVSPDPTMMKQQVHKTNSKWLKSAAETRWTNIQKKLFLVLHSAQNLNSRIFVK